jgi:hypothetical protein
MRPPRSHGDWPAARADLDRLEAAREPHAAAAAYVARYPKHPPDYFTDRSRGHARRAFDHGEGWAARLLTCLETPAHFSLHAEHLDLDRGAADPHLLFDRANVRRWRAAILRHFRGPCRWRLELGNAGRIHAHVLADLADGPPELARGGELAKPCERYFEAAVRYVLKPPLEYNAEHLAIWLEAKKRARLPALSGTHGIPQKRTWSNPSRLRVYFAKPPTKATSRHRSGPLNALSTKVSNRRTFTISKPSRKTYVGLEIRPLNTSLDEVAHRQPRERGPPPADQPTARTLDFCERKPP